MKKGSKTIKVEIPKTRYKRWRFVEPPEEDRGKNDGGSEKKDSRKHRVLLIDFRCIRSVPYKPVDYGSRAHTKWNSPAHLQGLVDEYFASCMGVIYDPKTRLPYMDELGRPRIGQIKPYTISGLACYIHIDTSAIKKYTRGQIDELGCPTEEDYVGPQYSDILLEARKKIEAFAEERLYDRDGFNGGRFVLNSAFGWREGKEEAEIQNMERMYKMKKKELKLKKDMIDEGSEEEPFTINIVRAKKKSVEE